MYTYFLILTLTRSTCTDGQSDFHGHIERHHMPPTFESFANQHILDTGVFKNLSKLTAFDFNRVMEQKANFQHQLTHGGGGDLLRKPTHILMVGTQEDVKGAFGKGPTPSIFGEWIRASNLGISNKSFPIIGLQRQGHWIDAPYTAWNCRKKFIVAGLNRYDEPTYLNGIQDSGWLPFPVPGAPYLNLLDCTRIQ